MAFDDRKNNAIGFVLTAPSPATSGTSLVLVAGDGAKFATPPFNATVGPPNTILRGSNFEIVRVTAKSTDTLTITRAQEGTSARSIQVGDIVYAGPTDKTFDDIETELAADTAMLASAFPLGVGAWPSFTPTLVQSGTVSKTVIYAKYFQIGKMVTALYRLDISSTGTASNEVRVGLPVTAATANALNCGHGFLFDASSANLIKGECVLDSTTYFTMVATNDLLAARLGATGTAFTAALASGDSITASVTYEAA